MLHTEKKHIMYTEESGEPGEEVKSSVGFLSSTPQPQNLRGNHSSA